MHIEIWKNVYKYHLTLNVHSISSCVLPFLSSFQLPQIPKPSGICPPEDLLFIRFQFAAGDIGDSSSGIAPGTGGISCFDPLGVGTSSLRIELVAETVFTLETAQASSIAGVFVGSSPLDSGGFNFVPRTLTCVNMSPCPNDTMETCFFSKQPSFKKAFAVSLAVFCKGYEF